MFPTGRREPQLDNGLTQTMLAETMMRVYLIGYRGYTPQSFDAEELDNLVPSPGWLYLASVVMTMYLASQDADQTFTAAELAENCYNNFYRGATEADPPVHYQQQSVRERLTWEVIARHAATVCHADQLEGIRHLELQWGGRLPEIAHTRGLALEHPVVESSAG